jgi:hypothetical protein
MLIVVILNVIMIETNIVRVIIVKLEGIIMYCFAKSNNAECNNAE